MNIKTHKQNLLDELYSQYQGCQLCPLAKLGRINIVFGEGNPDAKLLLIGEAPGREEDIQKKPFIGRSGKLLTKTLEALGIKREDLYITNVAKCRPPDNRLPLPAESKTCKQNLLFKQINIIKPKVICTLGACSTTALLEEPVKITKIRGIPTKYNNTIMIPTLHPAYVLRNQRELIKLAQDLEMAISISNK